MTTQPKSGETNEVWYGQNAQAQSDPLIDSGTGTPVIMRFFEFTANPEMFKHKPSNQDIFNSHAQQIRLMLWGDGLEPIGGIEPRIIRSKNKPSYRIMVTCTPKKGVALNDSTQTLQQIIQSNA